MKEKGNCCSDECNCSSDVYITMGRLKTIKDIDKELDRAGREIKRQDFFDGIKNSVEKFFIRRSDK